MERNSFLGAGTDELVSYKWHLPGIGLHPIAFGICRESGLIMQTETVTPSLMEGYYKNTATYINPDMNGQPTKAKIDDVKRQIELTGMCIGGLPKSALQIGSSDGFTLHCFQAAGVSRVLGVEPCETSNRYALDHYGVESINANSENCDLDESFDLLILTHILEHLFDPLATLRELKVNLARGGHILVEVPLWERADKQPIGVLAFEHLNYFCEQTLCYMLGSCGFDVIHVSKNYHINKYPVITVVAKNGAADDSGIPANKYQENRRIFYEYILRERDFWKQKNARIAQLVNSLRDTYIYGGGIHTSQLLSYLNLSSPGCVKAILDSSPSKWGKRLGEYSIQKTDLLDEIPANSNMIVSSLGWQKEIVETIKNRRDDLNIICLH